MVKAHKFASSSKKSQCCTILFKYISINFLYCCINSVMCKMQVCKKSWNDIYFNDSSFVIRVMSLRQMEPDVFSRHTFGWYFIESSRILINLLTRHLTFYNDHVTYNIPFLRQNADRDEFQYFLPIRFTQKKINETMNETLINRSWKCQPNYFEAESIYCPIR